MMKKVLVPFTLKYKSIKKCDRLDFGRGCGNESDGSGKMLEKVLRWNGCEGEKEMKSRDLLPTAGEALG